jgi:copper chaperone CopZ
LKVKTISIHGMNDAEDVKMVKDALYDVWGVTQVEVSLEKESARLTYDEHAASEIDIEQAVIDQGFNKHRRD